MTLSKQVGYFDIVGKVSVSDASPNTFNILHFNKVKQLVSFYSVNHPICCLE